MSKDLYVKNLAAETSEEGLRTLFSVCGKVSYIHMVRDPKGIFLGCAYVKMSSEAEAKDARVSLDGAWIDHKIIAVEVALPQRPKGSAPPAKAPAAPKAVAAPPSERKRPAGAPATGKPRPDKTRPTPPGKRPAPKKKR